MAVPKKRRSKAKTSRRKNLWKKKAFFNVKKLRRDTTVHVAMVK